MEILRILGLIEKNITLKIWLKKTQAKDLDQKIQIKQEIISLEEIEQNKQMIRKHKKFCPNLNYIEHFLILASAFTGCISISDFALFGIPIGITSSAVGLKICAIAS